MQFELDKCRILNIVKDKIQPGAFEIQNGETIAAMEAEKTYKYRGMNQAKRIDHRTMTAELTTEFVRRVRRILRINPK